MLSKAVTEYNRFVLSANVSDLFARPRLPQSLTCFSIVASRQSPSSSKEFSTQ